MLCYSLDDFPLLNISKCSVLRFDEPMKLIVQIIIEYFKTKYYIRYTVEAISEDVHLSVDKVLLTRKSIRNYLPEVLPEVLYSRRCGKRTERRKAKWIRRDSIIIQLRCANETDRKSS